MKRLQVPSILAALALSCTLALGQAPAPGAPAAPGATPAAPGTATPPPAATTTPPATGAAGAPAKAKPYTAGDVQKIKDFAEALQFHMRMGEIGKYKKEDKELAELATHIYKEAADYYTPLVNAAQAHQVQGKDIPSAVSNSDKSAIDKLGKSKPEKWKLEYFELFSKEAKKNARSVDAAAKSFTDPELKELATKAGKILDGQADNLEAKYKELKNPKAAPKK